MAVENRDWGYMRIIGALSNLGHNLAWHCCQHPQTAWHRTGTGAQPQDDVEGIPHATLGTDVAADFFTCHPQKLAPEYGGALCHAS